MDKNAPKKPRFSTAEIARTAGVALIVVGRQVLGAPWQVAWANEKACATLQIDANEVETSGIAALQAIGVQVDTHLLAAAKRDRYETTCLLHLGGTPSWMRLAATRHGEQDLAGEWWLLTLWPLRSAKDGQLRAAKLEASLALAARTAELLAVADSRRVLALVAELIERTTGHHAAFFALRHGRGLRAIDGMIADRHDVAEAPCERAFFDPVTSWWQAEGGVRTIRVSDERRDNAPSTIIAETLGCAAGSEITLIAACTATSAPLLLATCPAKAGCWSHAEVGELVEVACRRVAHAVEAFEHRSRQQVLIEALQRSMLPAHGDVGELDVWTYYLPYARIAHVGGDWFDIRTAADGTTTVILGDAVGHDVESIAVMNQIRTVLASLSEVKGRPHKLISRADTAVQGLRIANTAALSVAEFSRSRFGTWQLQYALAGHIPGLIVSAGAVRSLLPSASGLLGYPTATRVTHKVALRGGDAVVLFTDGLVERRGMQTETQIARLAKLLAAAKPPDAASIGEELLQLADGAEDDLSIVVVRIPGGPSSGPGARGRRWQLLATDASPATAREFTSRTLRQWQVPDQAVLVVVSELVSNAVMHGLGRISLRLQHLGAAIRIEVEDANPTPPTLRTDPLGASEVGGFGLQLVDELAEWGWRPSAVGKVVWALVAIAPTATPPQR